jgi:hypothetical protein
MAVQEIGVSGGCWLLMMHVQNPLTAKQVQLALLEIVSGMALLVHIL